MELRLRVYFGTYKTRKVQIGEIFRLIGGWLFDDLAVYLFFFRYKKKVTKLGDKVCVFKCFQESMWER